MDWPYATVLALYRGERVTKLPMVSTVKPEWTISLVPISIPYPHKENHNEHVNRKHPQMMMMMIRKML